MKKNLIKTSWVAALFIVAAVGCSKDPSPDTPPVESGKYLVAGVFDGATYFMTADDIEDPSQTVTPVGNNGFEVTGTFTHYVNNGTIGLLALRYGQGGTHVGAGFSIGSDGRAERVGTEFEIPAGFTTAGSFGNYVITARSGQTLTDGSKGAVVNFIDMANNNRLESKSMSTTDFPDLDGREVSLLGIADADNGEFFVGLEVTDGSPDSVYVAKLNSNLDVVQVYKDGRLSRSGGQFRSARYSQIGNDHEGNTYVFSGAAGEVTTKTAGALVIRRGADDFDPSYHFDIEAKSDGYRFRKVWEILEDYFLLEFYNDKGGSTAGEAAQYAVVKMSTQEFNWVSDLPAKETITNAGWPFIHNGKVYFGITTATDLPAVYSIDPVTGTGRKGITVGGVTSIPGLAFITD